jgi:hypothetical protein
MIAVMHVMCYLAANHGIANVTVIYIMLADDQIPIAAAGFTPPNTMLDSRRGRSPQRYGVDWQVIFDK